jgi:hypothetical protein
MEWEGYQISFRLLSPIHIGWRKSGNLQQTRPYITGRAMWGALTARLTREAGKATYEEVGRWVDERLAFTYLYPSTKADQVTIWPWEEGWDEFAWTYLGSYVSTALEDGRRGEDGSLHETEFISSRTRDGKQVYLSGYIFQREDWNELTLDLDTALNKLQIGGERGYGWGRLLLKSPYDEKPIRRSDLCFQDFEFDIDTGRPILKARPGDARLLAHTLVDRNSALGEIEPLLGRITDSKGRFGQDHSAADICLKPGGKVAPSAMFSIKPKGLWKEEPVTRL